MADAARSWSKEVKSLGDSIVALSLLQAKELGDYLKEEHGLEAAAGGAVVMAGPVAGAGAAAPAAAESTEFNVILTDGGDKKIQVIKEVRAATGLGLKEAKDLVEGAPKTVKEGMDKAAAEDLKKKLEAAGGKVKLEGV